MARGSRLHAMVQHPRCVFAYWELEETHLQAAARSLEVAREALRLVLRVYRLDEGDAGGASHLTVPIGHAAGRNYVHGLEPGGLYWVEVGVETAEGGFHRLLRSNIVETPPAVPGTHFPPGDAAGALYSPLAGVGG